MSRLVAVFSFSGKTMEVAERIAKENNADIFEIKAKDPYTAYDVNWRDFRKTYPDMRVDDFFTLERDGFYANRFELVSQYGTHVDAPSHFIDGKRNDK